MQYRSLVSITFAFIYYNFPDCFGIWGGSFCLFLLFADLLLT